MNKLFDGYKRFGKYESKAEMAEEIDKWEEDVDVIDSEIRASKAEEDDYASLTYGEGE